jgi:hypothetical protein
MKIKRKSASASRSALTLAQAENKNLQHNLLFLGNTYNLVSDLEVLYDAMPQIVLFPPDDPPSDETLAAVVVSNLTLICRRQLTLGQLTLLRGYRGDSQGHLRKGIEACAFSAKMTRHPEFAKVWLKAGEDDEAFASFRKKFAKDLFPSSDRDLSSLHEVFDRCSKAMHCSMYGVAIHFLHRDSHADKASIDFFDVRIKLNVFTWFMIVIRTHIIMLTILGRLLKPHMVSTHRIWWHEQLDLCKANYVQHQNRWQPKVDEYMKGEGQTSEYVYR